MKDLVQNDKNVLTIFMLLDSFYPFIMSTYNNQWIVFKQG